jgi:hypothetical protein
MRAQAVHHAVGVGIWVATAETDQVHRLTAKLVHNLARDVMRALHQIGHDNIVPDAFPVIGAKVSFQTL